MRQLEEIEFNFRSRRPDSVIRNLVKMGKISTPESTRGE